MRVLAYSALLLALVGCSDPRDDSPRSPAPGNAPPVVGGAAPESPLDAPTPPSEPEDQPVRTARAWRNSRLAAAKEGLEKALAEAKGDEALRAEASRRFDARASAIDETYRGVKAVFDAHKPTARDIEKQEWVLQSIADSIFNNGEERVACMKVAALMTDPEAAKTKRAACEKEFRDWNNLKDEGWENAAELLQAYVSVLR